MIFKREWGLGRKGKEMESRKEILEKTGGWKVESGKVGKWEGERM